MNKLELIDKAVKQKRGLIDKGNESADVVLWDGKDFYLVTSQTAKTAHAMGEADVICTISEYIQRAKELGWVNGYKWGVEYPTNGNKPDLPDDVIVSATLESDWIRFILSSQIKDCLWDNVKSFVITDCRYQPKSKEHLREKLPPIGSTIKLGGVEIGGEPSLRHAYEVKVIAHHNNLAVVYKEDGKAYFSVTLNEIAKQLKIQTMKSRKERFIDAATEIMMKNCDSYGKAAQALYDAGFRAPEDK